MFCPKCGAQLPEDARFCGACGSQMPAAAQAPRAEASADGATASWTHPAPSGAQTDGEPAKAAATRKRPALLISVIVGAVAIAAAVAVAVLALPGETGSASRLEEYTWAEIARMGDEIAACASEDEAVELAIGYGLCGPDGTLDGSQVKEVTLADGTRTSVQIVGFRHDQRADGGGYAGITFAFCDAIAARPMNARHTVEGGWEACDARAWLATEGLDSLPADLRDVIVPVKKLTNNAPGTEDPSCVTETADALWLFSSVEVRGKWYLNGKNEWSEEPQRVFDEIRSAEGSQYKLFSDQGVNQSTSWRADKPPVERTALVATRHQDAAGACDWWTRSPLDLEKGWFSCEFVSGKAPDDGTDVFDAEIENGIVPGFCVGTAAGTVPPQAMQSTAAASEDSTAGAGDAEAPAAGTVDYPLSEYVKDATVGDGYSYTATLRIGPWVRASDVEAVSGIWKAVGGSGDPPDTDDFARANPMSFNPETSVMAFGTLSVEDTTPGGFDIADSNSIMQQTVYSRDLAYSTLGCSCCVNFSGGNKFVVLTNGSGSSPGAVIELTPKMTGRAWGPVPFVVCCSGAISPEHPDGDPRLTESSWSFGRNEFTVPSMVGE